MSNPSHEIKAEQNREALYRIVKNNAPEAYRRAVEIATIPIFVNDQEKSAVQVEIAVMYLIAELLRLPGK